MSRIILDGKSAWFVSPDSKYGLTSFPAKNITDGDFTFLAKIKVYWDKMKHDDLTREGGIVIKNGLHLGMSVVKANTEHFYLKVVIWTIDPNLGQNAMKDTDILFKLNNKPGDKDKEYEVAFSFRKNEKEIAVYCDGKWKTKNFEGSLIDYSGAWLWIGAANPLDSCPRDFNQFFNGEISNIGIFAKALDKDEIQEIYEEFQNVSPRLKPIGLYDFETNTPYKSLDISGVGNHLVKFDKTWMDNI
jgi:hypothetical protein